MPSRTKPRSCRSAIARFTVPTDKSAAVAISRCVSASSTLLERGQYLEILHTKRTFHGSSIPLVRATDASGREGLGRFRAMNRLLMPASTSFEAMFVEGG